MFRSTAILLLLVCAGRAELRTLTLKQAAEVAATQSPEVLLSRIDEQRATAQVRIAKDPFVPKIVFGSGLAYSNGFPMSIEGSAPSIIQGRAIASVYNRSQRLGIAQAHEEARGAALATQARREDVMGRVVSAFLDAERRGRMVEYAQRQVESAEKVNKMVATRIEEGRELAIEGKRAQLSVARAQQRLSALQAERDNAEASLAYVLGMEPGSAVRPAGEERQQPAVPGTVDAAVEEALTDNREIRRLESALLAKGIEVQARKAERYPTLDLVAQYGLFARFNNYEDFFRKFQRNNGQLGVSIQIPLLFGPGRDARADIAQSEVQRTRLQINDARSRITMDTQKRYRELTVAEANRQVSRLDLDVARESLAVQLARFEEGRATLRQVEEARIAEQEKWMAYYDAVAQTESARYALLQQTGRLMAALR
ncbi:MAG: TolC family protein [Bryobacterales bacterium]|nr:TolC family protein [Bryobacterales bacterium]